ncbi:hypothetical protein ABPG74_022808 [Tetrahymena malaccensis]
MRELLSLQNQQKMQRNMSKLKLVTINIALLEQTEEEILFYLFYCFGNSAIRGKLYYRENLAINTNFQDVCIQFQIKVESIFNVILMNKRILPQISQIILTVKRSNKIVQLFRLMLEMDIVAKVIMFQNSDLETANCNYVDLVQQQLHIYQLFKVKVEPFMNCNPKMIYLDLFYD